MGRESMAMMLATWNLTGRSGSSRKVGSFSKVCASGGNHAYDSELPNVDIVVSNGGLEPRQPVAAARMRVVLGFERQTTVHIQPQRAADRFHAHRIPGSSCDLQRRGVQHISRAIDQTPQRHGVVIANGHIVVILI